MKAHCAHCEVAFSLRCDRRDAACPKCGCGLRSGSGSYPAARRGHWKRSLILGDGARLMDRISRGTLTTSKWSGGQWVRLTGRQIVSSGRDFYLDSVRRRYGVAVRS